MSYSSTRGASNLTTAEGQETIRVAIVGTGFGQKVHIPGFKAHPRTEVAAVYHRDIDKAEAIAKTHEIPFAVNTIEDIAKMENLQAVSISTPPFLHYEMAKPILAAGKHLLLEKPTTLSASEAKELYQIATEKNVVTAMDFEFRFVPAWQRLKELLEQGYCGKLRLIKVDWLVASRADANRAWNWYAQKDKGGGALGAIGSHSFDYIPWLFGPVGRLCGHLSTAVAQRPDPAAGGQLKPVDADDTGMLMLELRDGTPVQVTLSSATYGGRGHWLEVYGDRATLVLGSDNLKDYVHGFKLWGAPAGEELSELEIPSRLAFEKTYPDGRIAPFIRTIDNWLRGIDAAKASAPSLLEGVYSQLLMDITHESHATGRFVEVPTIEEFMAGG